MVLAGTYVAEQNAPSSYTLVCGSESIKAGRWSIAGGGLGGSCRPSNSRGPGRLRRSSLGRHGAVGSTLASALAPLLDEGPMEKAPETGEGKENSYKKLDVRHQIFRSSRIRASSMDCTATPREHSDSEFRDLLVPRCGWMQDQLDLVQNEPSKTSWHILLLSRTFKDKCVQHVAESLVEVLHLDMEEIASDGGLPGAMLLSRLPKSPRKASYGELFEKATEMKLTGTVEQPRKSLQSLPPVALPPAEAIPRRASLSGRRKPGSGYGGSEMSEVQVEDLDAMTLSSIKDKDESCNLEKVKVQEPESDDKYRQAQPAPVSHACSPKGCANFDSEGLPTVKQQKSSRAQCKQLQELVSKHMNVGKRQGPACQGRESNGSRLWGTVLDSLKQQCDAKKDYEAKRDACRLLRCFVFGSIGNEDAKTVAERDAIFKESMGTLQQVRLLHMLWRQLDEDNSGRVDIIEFRACAETHIRRIFKVGNIKNTIDEHNQQDYSEFAAGLCEKVERYLLGKKSSFIIDDMMKLLWLAATPSDIKTMKSWCAEFVNDAARARVDSPPPLELVEYEDLCSVFQHFDDEKRGEIEFKKLVERGLIYEDQCEQCQRDWDADGNGSLDMQEFCEMMCPAGFRACEASKVGTLKDGKRVIFDGNINGWRLEILPSLHRD